MADKDNLVDAHGFQLIDFSLDCGSDLRIGNHIAGAGDESQVGRCGADYAEELATFLEDDTRRDSTFVYQSLQSRFPAEVQVGAQVGRLSILVTIDEVG